MDELKNRIVSVVIPVHNEALNIPELHRRLSALGIISEMIFVDDGSCDDSVAILKSLQNSDPSIVVVSLNRSFGHQVAITAGLDHARGEAVITMDGDLQHPPEVIPAMIERWSEGFEVVNGARNVRKGESFLKKFAAALFYRVFRRIADYGAISEEDVGDFRLLDRKVVASLCSIRERRRYIRGLVSWMGFRSTSIFYEQSPRFAGESKYSFWKSFLLSLDAITTFSYVPLRVATGVGLFFSVMGFLLGFHALYLKLFTDEIQVPGWTVMFVELTFLGGVQLIVLGVLGEYLGRVFEEVRDRPLYYVKEVLRSDKRDEDFEDGGCIYGK